MKITEHKLAFPFKSRLRARFTVKICSTQSNKRLILWPMWRYI